MADAKLTDLTADTAPTSDDLTYVVDDPGGTPASRKVTLANLGKAIDHSVLTNLTSGDPHTQYRLEADNHTHQSSGAQAGTLDHGAALTGLTDDDHTQYLLASAATDRATFATNWTDLTDTGATTLHSHTLDIAGLTDGDPALTNTFPFYNGSANREGVINELLGLLGFAPGGRLTLTTAVPLTTSDVTAAGTLYYTPYKHNVIRVYDGTRWVVKTFSEISLSLSLTSGKNYDVFVDDDAATLSLSSAWTNDTTRADALGTQDNITVLSSDHTKLWLGAIRASGTNTTEDSLLKRFVCNVYQTEERKLYFTDTTAHNYGTNTVRAFNNSSTARVEAIIANGGQNIVNLWVNGTVGGQGVAAWRGDYYIGVDSTTAATVDARMIVAMNDSSANNILAAGAGPITYSSLGYHFFSINENSPNAVTTRFYAGGCQGYILA